LYNNFIFCYLGVALTAYWLAALQPQEV